MTIRPAQESDLEAIHHLNLTALEYDFPLEETKKRLARVLKTPGNRLFIAEEDGRVLGYVHAADYELTYAAPMKNILAIAVDGACRRGGVGRALLAAAEGWAKETGSAGIRLVSSEYRTGAHCFYTACGYTFRKNQKNFIKHFDA